MARWEYRPGWTPFLVWSHGRGLRDLFALHPDNTFVIKAAYLCWQERGTGDDRHEVVACMEGASEGKVHLPPAPRPDT